MPSQLWSCHFAGSSDLVLFILKHGAKVKELEVEDAVSRGNLATAQTLTEHGARVLIDHLSVANDLRDLDTETTSRLTNIFLTQS